MTCEADGVLVIAGGSSWPTCEPMVKCPYAPAPTMGTNWRLLSSMPINEFTKAYYRCNPGFEFAPNYGDPIPEGFNNATSTFELPCQSDGTIKERQFHTFRMT